MPERVLSPTQTTTVGPIAAPDNTALNGLRTDLKPILEKREPIVGLPVPSPYLTVKQSTLSGYKITFTIEGPFAAGTLTLEIVPGKLRGDDLTPGELRTRGLLRVCAAANFPRMLTRIEVLLRTAQQKAVDEIKTWQQIKAPTPARGRG